MNLPLTFLKKSKYYSFVLLLVLFNLPTVAQDNSIAGKWVLDRVVYKDGRRLEINNEEYSAKRICYISPVEMVVNDSRFPASIRFGEIRTQYTTFKYERHQEYLAIYQVNDDKISLYLRPDDFIKKYPEFTPVQTVIDGDSVTIANDLSDYEFKNDLSLFEFIGKRLTNQSSKKYTDLHFEMTYILTKHSRIRDMKILDSRGEKYDKEYLAALAAAAPFMINNTGTDLFFTREANYLKMYDNLTDPQEKKLFDLINEGDDFYERNEFEKAIAAYIQIKQLTIKEGHYKFDIRRAMTKLGISYLATNKKEEACATFQYIGKPTDFDLRHYFGDFCTGEKPE